ncbi:hypothetical protein [Tardiphaga sp.]|uniref:hypothetical protein n=1 Tax=Tardiphaga sp. TaxID=1926292 RepID=UPI00263103E9|nr:hypothetical protein [Tardiphaga sp.]MDB5620545.1 hypothetical protein [Tardiphaga sp.]
MTATEARLASISGTRQMIADDQFSALVAALVECNVIPRDFMASALDRLADGLIAKARGELESEFVIYPAEAFDRARDLSAQAAQLRSRL